MRNSTFWNNKPPHEYEPALTSLVQLFCYFRIASLACLATRSWHVDDWRVDRLITNVLMYKVRRGMNQQQTAGRFGNRRVLCPRHLEALAWARYPSRSLAHSFHLYHQLAHFLKPLSSSIMSDIVYRPRIEATTGPLVQVYEDGQVVVAVEVRFDTSIHLFAHNSRCIP
ncbi:hypothetical protein PENSPDRAFT_375579 [Peniophora sp. CONT]|nr:hypothetical protein PENSPDRAFT_375579 [Peniophora sp. CONT]